MTPDVTRMGKIPSNEDLLALGAEKATLPTGVRRMTSYLRSDALMIDEARFNNPDSIELQVCGF
jgi:hypothetical protein